MSWDAALETRYATIDQDHRTLLAMLGDFKKVIDTAPAPRVVAALTSLRQDVAQHFAYEERLMDLVGMPSTRDHREAHASYLADLQRSIDQLTKTGATQSLRQWAHGRLNTWFRFHIKAYDMALAKAVLDHERANGPIIAVTEGGQPNRPVT